MIGINATASTYSRGWHKYYLMVDSLSICISDGAGRLSATWECMWKLKTVCMCTKGITSMIVSIAILHNKKPDAHALML